MTFAGMTCNVVYYLQGNASARNISMNIYIRGAREHELNNTETKL